MLDSAFRKMNIVRFCRKVEAGLTSRSPMDSEMCVLHWQVECQGLRPNSHLSAFQACSILAHPDSQPSMPRSSMRGPTPLDPRDGGNSADSRLRDTEIQIGPALLAKHGWSVLRRSIAMDESGSIC